MARYLDRDRAAVAAAFLPLRSSWSNTNMALVLVVAVVAVAAMGNRLAGALAALSAAAWFDFFYTAPFERLASSGTADIRTGVPRPAVGPARSPPAPPARRPKGSAITDARYLAE